ncbi:hypothetical protein SDC9_192156 [bioreactor metagenome]|uniref:Uncharacterized protein n=1 Tax=bioreactor metagenome TaxID=1076179 RepID=A0A645HZW7_9ZZZZ
MPDLAKELLQSAECADLAAERAPQNQRERYRCAKEHKRSDDDLFQERSYGKQRERGFQSAVGADGVDGRRNVAERMQHGCREHKGEEAAKRYPAKDARDEREAFVTGTGDLGRSGHGVLPPVVHSLLLYYGSNWVTDGSGRRAGGFPKRA